ncbi:MAG TPA: hypothetical protein PLT86_00775 [Candidatus Latescibacteria bacterium]|nr:hypothetical protein [Candidatus Latescibacterota bacterium]HPC43711.1 hypothetical protein [Candidatus Latescibacterota bacterium]HQI75121.1 hypothetical protein [Candidatus Latescibacterota bacterium]HQK22896.1 hypothetical protein [Candidatus Latescibacterota bacterium]
MRYRLLVPHLLVFAAACHASSIFSYHPRGLGYAEWKGDARTMGMGGVSLANSGEDGATSANPAGIAGCERTALSASFLSQKRSVKDYLGYAGTFYDQYPRFFRAVVPIGRGIVSSFGLEPVGDVRMIWANRNTENGVSYLDSLEASGGAWSFGAQVARSFGPISLGLKAQVVRGNMTTEWRRTVVDSAAPLATSALAMRRISGAAFSLGSAYRVSEEWAIGGRLDFPSNLSETDITSYGTRIPNQYYKSHTDVVMAVASDLDDTTSSTAKLPVGFGAGVAWRPGERLLVSLDGEFRRWSDVDPAFRNTWCVAGGVEFRVSDDYRSFLLWQLPYRAGVRWEQHYVPALSSHGGATYPDGKYLTLGAGIPLGRNRGRLDYSVEYGTRGTISTNLVREKLWRHTISVVGWERWFERSTRR